MKSIKKYSGILLTVLLCLVLSLMMAMTASAALIDGEDPNHNYTVDEEDTFSEDGTETPDVPLTSEDGEEDPATSEEGTESDTESTESTESEEDYTSTESEEEGEASSEEYNEGDESYYEEKEDDPEYYPGNGEDITGVIGTGDDEWGANYSEGTVVSGTGSTAKKNIADYHSKMLSLIWIPIVLIVLAVGTLVVVNVYYSKKKGKKAGKGSR